MHKLFEIPSITLFLCTFYAFLWLKNPRNLRNPWLIKYLCACKALYICRELSTNTERSLQIKLFMQNKANLKKSQMNVRAYKIKKYGHWTLGERETKQSQTKPISKEVSTRETHDVQLLARRTFSTNILPGRAL